jgi:hypothetical protein
MVGSDLQCSDKWFGLAEKSLAFLARVNPVCNNLFDTETKYCRNLGVGHSVMQGRRQFHWDCRLVDFMGNILGLIGESAICVLPHR